MTYNRGSYLNKFRNGWYFYRDHQNGTSIRGVTKQIIIRDRPPELLTVKAWSKHERDTRGNDTTDQSALISFSIPLDGFRRVQWEDRLMFETEDGQKSIEFHTPTPQAPWERKPSHFFKLASDQEIPCPTTR